METPLLGNKTEHKIIDGIAKRILLLIVAALSQTALTGAPVSADSIFSRIERQREIFPQEKAYLMTDRNDWKSRG